MSAGSDARGEGADPFLAALGERVRRMRARRGMTRKELARAASVSERHLANLEQGVGNASILVLRQIASAFNCVLAELVGDVTTSTPEWLLIRQLLEDRPEQDLQRARQLLAELFDDPDAQRRNKLQQIALIGLRGAGKSTLGRLLAADLGYPFVELSAEIERVAGCGILEIHSLYGPTAYRRYERRALEESLQIYPEMVLATPGGLVSEPGTLNLLLSHCYTIWLRASPEDHMQRVMAQGDFRPMAGNNEAMADLKRILSSREAFYAKADWQCLTSEVTLQDCFAHLREHVREATGLEA
ncbi:helix-turn-helix domain-containing protein [Allopusillimonas soli]|uniref:Shikimate kinase n=1 Tax=Allopusillimonas soli TaxID=659016 RepID=A0A853FEM5_9BURK|nr:helix-turn-helix transcriptional regulator [Allopusillimonas soli]NYT38513.1 helix-turn-helix transcriptional regulator [Allopusillimonas soli]TEA71826.1 helix-turn-helix domain-containing protein [Allopusillimonas soli]